MYIVDIQCTYVPSICMYMNTTLSLQDGFSPLYVASEYGHKEIVDILLNNKADPNMATMVGSLVCI